MLCWRVNECLVFECERYLVLTLAWPFSHSPQAGLQDKWMWLKFTYQITSPLPSLTVNSTVPLLWAAKTDASLDRHDYINSAQLFNLGTLRFHCFHFVLTLFFPVTPANLDPVVFCDSLLCLHGSCSVIDCDCDSEDWTGPYCNISTSPSPSSPKVSPTSSAGPPTVPVASQASPLAPPPIASLHSIPLIALVLLVLCTRI